MKNPLTPVKPKHWDIRKKSGFLFFPKTCIKRDNKNFTTKPQTRWLVYANWTEIYTDWFCEWKNGVWLD
jgi:hypothetical protein